MKPVIAVILAFFSAHVNAQVQSSCFIPPAVYISYGEDVKNLALKRILDLKSADTSLVDIPQSYQDTIWKGLAAIHNLGSQLSADSVFYKYCVHISPPRQIASKGFYVHVDTAYPWTKQWTQYNIHTGNGAVDSLISHYGFTISYVSLTGGTPTVFFTTSQIINIYAFTDSIQKFAGVYKAFPSWGIGDGSYITYSKDDTVQYYDFYLQWGDCPAGCTSAKIWKYKVDTNCVVSLLSSKVMGLDPFPSPVNCNLSTPIINISGKTPEVFPNPATDFLSVKNILGSHSYKIFGVNGQVLQTGVIQHNDKIALPEMSEGIYYIQLYDKSNSTVHKFIKQ